MTRSDFQRASTPESFIVSYNPELQQIELFSAKDEDLARLRETNVVGA
ncbi:hypothetical protein [Burkholderia sp. SRS-W-2-2016]|nr:hypothetical protein [Burkholderia sp. SRS-W-2-2016]